MGKDIKHIIALAGFGLLLRGDEGGEYLGGSSCIPFGFANCLFLGGISFNLLLLL